MRVQNNEVVGAFFRVQITSANVMWKCFTSLEGE